MDEYLEKKSTHDTRKKKKTNWKFLLVGWKRTLISALFVVLGVIYFLENYPFEAGIAALLVGIGIYAYGVIKNIWRNK